MPEPDQYMIDGVALRRAIRALRTSAREPGRPVPDPKLQESTVQIAVAHLKRAVSRG